MSDIDHWTPNGVAEQVALHLQSHDAKLSSPAAIVVGPWYSRRDNAVYILQPGGKHLVVMVTEAHVTVADTPEPEVVQEVLDDSRA